ncbi:type II toxin-antitoxin system PemK/MazF family toxin [Mesorhizobium calcicola]|uniref:Type II toxin-antitoxin system PemK/MazF family toxin n=1 Tax=Mesorhizobium calcicola TaxID=1300310 RepID=A0ABW4WE44_9HYPH
MRGTRGWDTTKLSIRYAPSPREVYWIGTFEDSAEPEFTGFHPGVILSGTKTLNELTECVTFVPITSSEPTPGATGRFPPYVFSLSQNPNPVDDRPVWAVCNHVMTVKLSRLERYIGETGPVVPKVSHSDFEGILDAVANGMVALRNLYESRAKQALNDLAQTHIQTMSTMVAEQDAQREAYFWQRLDEMTVPAGSSQPLTVET